MEPEVIERHWTPPSEVVLSVGARWKNVRTMREEMMAFPCGMRYDQLSM